MQEQSYPHIQDQGKQQQGSGEKKSVPLAEDGNPQVQLIFWDDTQETNGTTAATTTANSGSNHNNLFDIFSSSSPQQGNDTVDFFEIMNKSCDGKNLKKVFEDFKVASNKYFLSLKEKASL